MKKTFIGLEGMSLQELASIARDQVKVKLTEGSKKRILASRKLVEQWLKKEKAVYGITTGFGALSDVRISSRDARKLQRNILMSHACGVGIGKAINGGFGLLLDGSKKVDEIIKKAIVWDVMGGVARRAWARNENSVKTSMQYNQQSKGSNHITLPFIADEKMVKDIVARAFMSEP